MSTELSKRLSAVAASLTLAVGAVMMPSVVDAKGSSSGGFSSGGSSSRSYSAPSAPSRSYSAPSAPARSSSAPSAPAAPRSVTPPATTPKTSTPAAVPPASKSLSQKGGQTGSTNAATGSSTVAKAPAATSPIGKDGKPTVEHHNYYTTRYPQYSGSGITLTDVLLLNMLMQSSHHTTTVVQQPQGYAYVPGTQQQAAPAAAASTAAGGAGTSAVVPTTAPAPVCTITVDDKKDVVQEKCAGTPAYTYTPNTNWFSWMGFGSDKLEENSAAVTKKNTEQTAANTRLKAYWDRYSGQGVTTAKVYVVNDVIGVERVTAKGETQSLMVKSGTQTVCVKPKDELAGSCTKDTLSNSHFKAMAKDLGGYVQTLRQNPAETMPAALKSQGMLFTN